MKSGKLSLLLEKNKIQGFLNLMVLNNVSLFKYVVDFRKNKHPQHIDILNPFRLL